MLKRFIKSVKRSRQPSITQKLIDDIKSEPIRRVFELMYMKQRHLMLYVIGMAGLVLITLIAQIILISSQIDKLEQEEKILRKTQEAERLNYAFNAQFVELITAKKPSWVQYGYNSGVHSFRVKKADSGVDVEFNILLLKEDMLFVEPVNIPRKSPVWIGPDDLIRLSRRTVDPEAVFASVQDERVFWYKAKRQDVWPGPETIDVGSMVDGIAPWFLIKTQEYAQKPSPYRIGDFFYFPKPAELAQK